MEKNFFVKVGEFFGGSADNSIDKKDDLINAIMRIMKSNYAGMKISLKDSLLKLCISDSFLYKSLISDKFEENLLTSIYDELGFELGKIEIIYGNVTDEMTQVMDSCYMLLQPIQYDKAVSKAIICQVSGYGSIIGESVCLDSQDMESLPDHRYNIGVGRYPSMSDNSHRENQIAIDDNPFSEAFDKNKYVSRAHAHITYSAEYGFLLYVEHGGTRASQKRTHIHRGGTQIELNNPLVPEPLNDGDYIVLSKYVHLLFKKA